MRGNNHTARVSRPVFYIQPRIVLDQEGIARVAENTLNEVQVSHATGRGEKAGLQ